MEAQTSYLARLRDTIVRHVDLCQAAVAEIPDSDPGYEVAAQRAEAAVEALEHFGKMLRCFCSMLGIHGPQDVPGYLAAHPNEGPRTTNVTDHDPAAAAEDERPTGGGAACA
jgi:hypothetical protein